ncbi:GNAT family N-acetyltransferase [Nocardia ninae]|uniref:Lysine N-acyltransferase MbtK n=1 Tax=Nocardia ninae NBRC 108245 TaxID=1210091 RepID=A0A511M9A0_9NOCA|nr:GNAT family N-acetyltransferase [Nocardia ninae]GEM37234.1 hypothetical protein NN4_17530 [Nocardia ninae NBRC 108245]
MPRNGTGTPYVFPRELTDISDDVREAPEPVVPSFSDPYSLRTVDPDSADPETLADWMARPHLLETWEQAWSAERRRIDSRAQLAGTYSRPCILGFDFAAVDRPDLGRSDVAYIELYRAAKDEIAKLYEADALDMGFHIATADPSLVGRGVMSAWIGQLATEVWRAEPQCRRLMCDPDYRNLPMRKALQKNGWRHLGEFDIRPDRRISLHTLPREPEDMPALRR